MQKIVPADKRLFPLDVIAYNQMSSQDTHLQVGADGQVSFRPRLNITAFWLGADDAEFITTSKLSENGSYHIVSSLNFSGNGVLNTSQLRFTNGWNETNPTFFDLPYIEQWGSCQPVSDVCPIAAAYD